jgi:hypothetical protein
MKVISTKTHGILDYSAGILLILAPWIFGFAIGGAVQTVPIVVGLLIITMSILTNYEAGAVNVLSMSFHLNMDILAGLFLALSPWLFGFANTIVWPHLVFGLLIMGAGLLTDSVPYRNSSRASEMHTSRQ